MKLREEIKAILNNLEAGGFKLVDRLVIKDYAALMQQAHRAGIKLRTKTIEGKTLIWRIK